MAHNDDTENDYYDDACDDAWERVQARVALDEDEYRLRRTLRPVVLFGRVDRG